MKRYMVLAHYNVEDLCEVWSLLEETDSLAEAVKAWEARGVNDETVLVEVVCESVDM